MYIDLYQFWSLKSGDENQTTRNIYKRNILPAKKSQSTVYYIIYLGCNYLGCNKQTNRILNRKIAHLHTFILQQLILLQTGVYVEFWICVSSNTYKTNVNSEFYLFLLVAVHTRLVSFIGKENPDFIFFTRIYLHPKNVMLLCCTCIYIAQPLAV